MNSMKNSLTAAIVVLLVHSAAHAGDAETLAQIDKQLAELKTFQYERNGDPIRDLETTILQLPAESPLRSKIEDMLIAALGPSNDIGKGIICRQLRAIGTDKCIPVVASMLKDPKQTDSARLALQGIGSKTSAKAMHDALNQTTGAVQVGLINALAELDYEPLRSDCIRLIQANDPVVAKSAIRALGKLGGVESLKALTQLKGKASEQLSADIDLAIVAGAEKLIQAGQRQTAKAHFAILYEQGGPSRLAALRGLVMADTDNSAEVLVEAIRGQDSQLAMWAISLIPYVTGKDATETIVAHLKELPAEPKSRMIQSLGLRGDQVAAPAIVEAAKNDNAAVRRAAIGALGGLSGNEAIDTLLEVAANGAMGDKPLARAALLRVRDAEAQLANMARGSEETVAVEAIRALASRKAAGQSKLILELTGDENPAKRAAAIDALGVLIDIKSIDALVKLALEESRAGDLKEIERSLARVLNRIDVRDDRARPLLQALPTAPARVQPMFIRLLSKAGTEGSLAAVRQSLRNTDSDASDAAVVALSSWPNTQASNDLVNLIETARTSDLKTTALNGFLRIASSSDDPSTMLLGALKQVTSVDTQKRILEAIGQNCDSYEAITATQSLFEEPELKSTAALATIRIANKLRQTQEDKARMVLARVIAKVDDPEAQKEAREVLNDIDKYQDHIMRWVAIGPFGDKSILSGEQSYKTVYEPEQADTSKLEWKPLTLGIGRWEINLEANYGPMDHCCTYVRTMVWSPVDQDVQVEGGCDDALKMWVNGGLIYDKPRTGGGSPRTMIAPATLSKGWNELKLKAVDHEGGWAFGCRIRKPDGTKLDGLKFEAR